MTEITYIVLNNDAETEYTALVFSPDLTWKSTGVKIKKADYHSGFEVHGKGVVKHIPYHSVLTWSEKTSTEDER